LATSSSRRSSRRARFSTLLEESSYPADWLRLAEKDLSRTKRLLEEDAELAGFCLQQAVEKFLKAFLLAKGWGLRRIHDLDALLDDAVAHDPGLEAFRPACQRITKYYIVERYPLNLGAELTEREVRESLGAVGPLVDRLREGAR
jgi:HEPN domain-containing protein